jgi:hypothetical protein
MGMQRWNQEYLGHPVWQSVQQCRELLSEGGPPEDPSIRDHYDRLVWLLGYLDELRENATPLVGSEALAALNAAMTNVQNQLDAWSRQQGDGYLTNAGGQYAELVLAALRGWPPSRDRLVKGTTAAALAVTAEADKVTEALKERAEAVRTQLDEDRASSETNVTEAQAALVELRSQAATIRSDIDTQVKRFDDALNGWQQTFSEAEAERASEHRESLKAMTAEAKDAATESKKSLESGLREQVKLGQAHVAELTSMRDKADNLLNAIALTGTATEYGRYAQNEPKRADIWQGVASAAFLASFAWLVVTLIVGHVTGHTAWQLVAYKFGGSVALFALGVYAGHESDSHRGEERTAKSKQLDLAALDPFIANLAPDDQRDIKAAAGRRLFTEPATPPPVAVLEPDGVDDKLLRRIVDELVKRIKS